MLIRPKARSAAKTVVQTHCLHCMFVVARPLCCAHLKCTLVVIESCTAACACFHFAQVTCNIAFDTHSRQVLLSYVCMHALELPVCLQQVERQTFLTEKILPRFEALTKSSGKLQPVKTTVIYVPDTTPHGIGKAICTYAKNNSAEALVMERTSKNTLTEFFLGSVASYCANHCPVPLVILKN